MTADSATASLLDDRPELESALQTVLSVDADHDTWTFDDVAIDSGAFGELVSRGVVEKEAGEYRLADPEGVRAALDGEAEAATDDGASTGPAMPALSLPTVEGRVALALGGLLLFVALMRTVFAFPSVFRADVVLSGNDPYYYRYWVETILANPDVGPGSLPTAVAKGEPLMVTTLWALTALLGGTAAAAGWVLAWYPVLSAVLTAAIVYLLATRLTRDRRVGLASVAMLAVLPAHGYRTSLGFADHHAFDYVWLALALLALYAVLSHRGTLRDRGVWLASAGVGVAVAGQVLAWEAGPLLVIPVGIAAAAAVLVDAREERSSLSWGLPLLAGLALATVLTLGAHSTLGWHTDTVVRSPAILLAGTALVVGVGVLVDRTGLSWQVGAGGVAAASLLSLLGLRYGLPDYWREAMEELGRLGSARAIVETRSLLEAGAGSWLLLFGLLLFVALAYMAWATRELARGNRSWAAPTAYGWWLFLLTLFQIRFGGEASVPFALFAGLGFVHLAERVDLTTPPVPFRNPGESVTSGFSSKGDHVSAPPKQRSSEGRSSLVDFSWPTKRQASALVALFLLVGGLGMIQVPVKTSQLTIEDSTYQTAMSVNEYAAEHGISYPDNYVLSQWGRNRVYNYFVNGESASYGFARQQYAPTLSAGAGTAPPDRVGFMIVERVGRWKESSVMVSLLRYGEAGTEELGRYRAISNHSGKYAFAVVPGALVSGSVDQTNATVTLATDVRLENWAFTYRRTANATNGQYTARVAHPGEYRVLVDGERVDTVTVPEPAVRNGTQVAG